MREHDPGGSKKAIPSGLSVMARRRRDLKRFKGAAARKARRRKSGRAKGKTLESTKRAIAYIQQRFTTARFARDPGKRAALLVRFAQAFPITVHKSSAPRSRHVLFAGAEHAKNAEVANGLLAKDPNNLGMLLVPFRLLLRQARSIRESRTVREKSDLRGGLGAKARGAYGRTVGPAEGPAEGTGLSSLGQVNIEKKITPKRWKI